jgi:hypothetical protein
VSRPEINGERGAVQQYDPSSGRYIVVLEDTDETMSAKPAANLLPTCCNMCTSNCVDWKVSRSGKVNEEPLLLGIKARKDAISIPWLFPRQLA